MLVTPLDQDVENIFHQVSTRQNLPRSIKACLFLHKKWSFPLRISSVNVTKSVGNCGFGHIYWRNPWWETSFFAQLFLPIRELLRCTLMCNYEYCNDNFVLYVGKILTLAPTTNHPRTSHTYSACHLVLMTLIYIKLNSSLLQKLSLKYRNISHRKETLFN